MKIQQNGGEKQTFQQNRLGKNLPNQLNLLWEKCFINKLLENKQNNRKLSK